LIFSRAEAIRFAAIADPPVSLKSETSRIFIDSEKVQLHGVSCTIIKTPEVNLADGIDFESKPLIP
jgi:hypothetical protein